MSLAPALQPVRLRTDELTRGPWIFGRQVEEPGNQVTDGELVEVRDQSERFLGHAFFNRRSDVRLRFLSRGRKQDLQRPVDFFERRLRDADRLRRRTLDLERVTNAYRLAHGEGDDLPGLIVDRLGEVLVCEHHALGFWMRRAEIEEALGRLHPGCTVVHRVPNSARGPEGFDAHDDAAAFEPQPGVPAEVVEHGLAFDILAGAGHKTGWFCDQRENRARVADLARGRFVVDLFCNAGGFALHAARAGAREVWGVDLDEVVLDVAVSAGRRNEQDVHWVHADAFDVLRDLAARPPAQRPELIVVDPHKLVRGRADLEKGKRTYLDINALAFQAVRPGGLVASFSCSGAVDLPTFLGFLFGAARRADRDIRLLEVLGAGPDHPQRPDWPRSRYLKGALLAVDR